MEMESIIKNAIKRGERPEHFMLIKPIDYPVAAAVQCKQVAYTKDALRIQEVGNDIYLPVIYFPPEDVCMNMLIPSTKKTKCPLKGVTTYFDVICDGTTYSNVAWSYVDIYSFDERLTLLKDKVAFDTRYVQLSEFSTLVR